jgi:WD40 repeat protein
VTEAVLALPPSPYKGLAAFADSELDALFFFGREREIEVIAANLIAARLTVLYGPSGVGKTSLLRAGVTQRLRSEGAAIVVFSNWSGDPVAGLLAAVEREVHRVAPELTVPPPGSPAEILSGWSRRLGADLYLVLDQFEEYFLYHAAQGEAGPLAALAEAISQPGARVHVVLSIREDALAQLDAFKSQLPGLFGNSLRLDRLDQRAARRAILGPLERYNELVGTDDAVEAESELGEEILASVETGRIQLGDTGRGAADDGPSEPGRIEAPYLQLVLERLWEVEAERASNRLRLETLRELGGATRIVEDHLERAMAALSPGEKDAAAAMYNHLVTPSGTKIAHRAGDLARYAAVDEQDAQRVLERLARERIVRAGEDGSAGPHYEIFHDVLADAVLAWRTRHEAERRLEEERRAAEIRQRRLIALAGAAVVAVAVLAGIAAYALSQRSTARGNAREAAAHDLAALAEGALASSPERSLELALQASAKARTPTVANALRRTSRTLRTLAVLEVGSPVADIAFSPDGNHLAVASEREVRVYSQGGRRLVRTLPHRADAASFSRRGNRLLTAGAGGARVWDVRSWKQLVSLPHPRGARTAAFSPDSSVIGTTGEDRFVRIWDARIGRILRTLRHPRAVTDASFNRYGTLVATTSDDPFVRVFAVRTGRLLAKLRHGRAVARFAPDKDLLATGGADKMVRLWSPRTGDVHAELEGHVRGLVDLTFSRDGRFLATGSSDATTRVWNPTDGTLVAILPGHTNHVTRLDFSPDGEMIVTGNRDRVARVFDPDSGTLRAGLAGHREAVTEVAFSPTGRTVATGSSDGTVRVWDAVPYPDLELVAEQKSAVTDVAFTANGQIVSASDGEVLSEDGRLAARVDKGGKVRVRDVLSGRFVRTIRHPGHATTLAFDERGERLVTGAADGTIRVWRVSDGRLDRVVRGPRGITAVALSPNGERLLAAGRDAMARIWNLDNGNPERTLSAHNAPLTSGSFSGSGRFVVTTNRDYDARLFDVETGEQVWVLSQAAIVSGADFSADGRWVAIAGPGYAGVVDARTGERILLLNGHDRILTSVAFSPTGWRIATGGESGAVRTYDCRLCGGINELVKLGEQRLAQLRAVAS